MKKAVKIILACLMAVSCFNIKTVNLKADEETEEIELSTAEELIEEAVEYYEFVQQCIDEGALGFFRFMGSDKAVEVLENAPSTTDINGDYDATSLENMRYAIDIIRVCNEIRNRYGDFGNSYSLVINDTAMAMAQVQCNISCYTMGHSRYYSANENLAWGYAYSNLSSYYGSAGPFDSWYYTEKGNYASGSGETGHFLAVTGSKTVSGAAVNQKGRFATVNQIFLYQSDSYDEGYYTVGEYIERFDNYCDTIDDELEKARENIELAWAVYDYVAHVKSVITNKKKSEIIAEYILQSNNYSTHLDEILDSDD